MKKYSANGSSFLIVDNVEPEETDKIKIKVTHVMPTESDINIYTGSKNIKYPFTFGHMAIGVISDDRPEYGLKRGTKVILNPYTIEPSYRLDMAGSVHTKGIDSEGFLQDFVFLNIGEFVPFPDEVGEEEAIFTEKIAIAMAAINSFGVEKGDYVVIVGGGVISNIIAQLSLYFQLIPIMIDTMPAHLEKANQKGIYYTIDATKEVPYDRIKEITGGRMSEHTIVEASGRMTGAYLFSLSRNGGDCTLICEHNAIKTFDADVSAISRNQLKVRGVSNGATEFNSAINILAQNILNLDGFIECKTPVEDAEVVLRDIAQNPDLYFSTLISL